MILQKLHEYHSRLVREGNTQIPSFGFSVEKVWYEIELRSDGSFVFNPIFDTEGSRKIAKSLLVPLHSKRSGARPDPFFLCDNSKFVLGVGYPEDDEKTQPPIECHRKYKELFQTVCGDSENPEVQAVLRFFEVLRPDCISEVPGWTDDIIGRFLVFRVSGMRHYVHESPGIRELWMDFIGSNEEAHVGRCMISGEIGTITRIHDPIKGVRGGQSTGGTIVGFNDVAFWSYGGKSDETRFLNAPVGESVAAGYVAALNYLLRRGSSQMLLLNDTTLVFWSEAPAIIEPIFGDLIDPIDNGEADSDLMARIYNYLQSLRSGKMPADFQNSEETEFYILALSPNNARISIRDWLVSTVEKMSEHIGLYWREMMLIHDGSHFPEFPGIRMLLTQMAPLNDMKRIPPSWEGWLLRSILEGKCFPEPFLTAIFNRIRSGGHLSYPRISLIKAMLIRNYGKEVAMQLDWHNSSTGYRMGMLFAALEKAQRDASGPGLKATIRDRYFNAASSTPERVFPVLMKLSQSHLSKSGNIWDDQLITRVMSEISVFPKTLPLAEQGMFAIGYYHMKNEIYSKRNNQEVEDEGTN
ncbi:MAG: type I-C CRISPR-associated protein Cas8c/Csd1 [Candidatus Aminicenantes bacterium]|nr:type I-C CRISPR-associated protein Cas8c/Csd1 [Candidatus Aminicenantes bacterium]